MILKMRRFSVTLSDEHEDIYNEIYNNEVHGKSISNSKVLAFLLELYMDKPKRGSDKAKRRLLEFLHLGTDGEKITVAMIRGVDKISKKKGIKALNAIACKEVYAQYKEQIEAYNSKL